MQPKTKPRGLAPLAPHRCIPNVPLPPGAKLWYGWGSDPYCNLVDDANMAAPVFGPMEIEGVSSED